MGKVVASLGLAFSLGWGSLALLGGVLGPYAEAASLGLAGLSMVASGHLLAARRGAVSPQDVQGSRAA